jgi:signal transduction histidine kinase
MADDTRDLAREGVRFFGEISASISHELKNVLAIINENAGLLADMVRLGAHSVPISPERLARLADSLAGQVRRGNRIVESMNRFAHSADLPVESVDLAEAVEFVCSIAARLIAVKGQPPQIDCPALPVTVSANRFYLENLIWSALNRSMNACATDGTITITVEPGPPGARIRFRGRAINPAAGGALRPCLREEMVARFLGAKLTADEGGGEIAIILG